ncbi:hypothetical protein AURDEDRAFT_146594 [Auricularia subglabra TFB-10046 SS5]|nr:hypothetical protein AURDEDRAFT_146594 [Auricularia subglabra TFB-10046 SS5]
MEQLLASLRKPYSDLRTDAERITAGLSDSNRPGICPRCIGEFAMAVAAHQANLLRLRAEYHQVFDACLAMICTWPALHKADALREILMQNNACCPVPGHPSDLVKPADHPSALYNLAAGVIICALDIGDRAPTVRAVANKSFSDRAGRWPSKVDQLLPLGEQSTVLALLAFAETYTCAAPMMVLRQLVILARTLVWPVLVAGENRRRLLFLIIALLAPVVHKEPPRWLMEENTLELAVSFLSDIRAGPDAVPREREQFVGGDADILYKAVLFRLNKVPSASEAFPELAAWCLILYHTLPEGNRPKPPTRALRWQDELIQRKKPSLGLAMHMSLSRLLQLRACSFCSASSIRSEDGKALPACAGCKVMRYCSRNCQKRHWNLKGDGDRVAHKAVCPVLRRLDVYAYANQEPEVFAEAFEKVEPNLSPEEMETVKDWISEVRRALGESPLVFDKKFKKS